MTITRTAQDKMPVPDGPGVRVEIADRVRAIRESGGSVLPPVLLLGVMERVGSNWVSDTLRPVTGQHNEPFRQQVGPAHPLHGRHPAPGERTRIALFPTRVRNPAEEESITYGHFNRQFRQWLGSLDLGGHVAHQARHTLATKLQGRRRILEGDLTAARPLAAELHRHHVRDGLPGCRQGRRRGRRGARPPEEAATGRRCLMTAVRALCVPTVSRDGNRGLPVASSPENPWSTAG